MVMLFEQIMTVGSQRLVHLWGSAWGVVAGSGSRI